MKGNTEIRNCERNITKENERGKGGKKKGRKQRIMEKKMEKGKEIT